LPKDDAHVLGVLLPVFVRHVAVNQQVPARGLEDAGHHLDRRGFACPIGADVADDLAWLDVERDAIHGPDGPIVAGEQIPHRAHQSLATIQNLKVPGDVFGLY